MKRYCWLTPVVSHMLIITAVLSAVGCSRKETNKKVWIDRNKVFEKITQRSNPDFFVNSTRSNISTDNHYHLSAEVFEFNRGDQSNLLQTTIENTRSKRLMAITESIEDYFRIEKEQKLSQLNVLYEDEILDIYNRNNQILDDNVHTSFIENNRIAFPLLIRNINFEIRKENALPDPYADLQINLVNLALKEINDKFGAQLISAQDDREHQINNELKAIKNHIQDEVQKKIDIEKVKLEDELSKEQATHSKWTSFPSSVKITVEEKSVKLSDKNLSMETINMSRGTEIFALKDWINHSINSWVIFHNYQMADNPGEGEDKTIDYMRESGFE